MPMANSQRQKGKNMKKIFVVLSVVAMMFAACTPDNGDNTPQKPNFPEMQNLTVESGKSYEITFSTDKAWTLVLPAESQVYASMTYDGVTDTQFYGEAGEATITVNVREGLMSYAKDMVFSVDMTLGEYTQSIAQFTIPRTPYAIDVYGSAPEGFENILSQFLTGGHPENGPFVNAPNKYTVLYLNASEAKYGDYVVAHDFDKLYNYVVYAKNSEGVFAPITESTKWLEHRAFRRQVTDNKGNSKYYGMFSLAMDYTKSDAVFTEGVGYEAYVNIEDENGDAIVSVYFLYDPNAEVVVETKVELANEDLAAEKGVVFDTSSYTYTLTYPSADILTTYYEAAALKFTGYNEVYGGFGSGTKDLIFEHNEVDDIWYVRLAEGASVAGLMREEVLNISAVSNELHSYTINLVFDWIADNGGSNADGSISFVNAEVANAAGATLVKLNSTDADYNSEWGVEAQYRLTYTSAELLTTPAKAALNVEGFDHGLILNIDDMSADHFNYSEALDFFKDTTTGEVLLGYSPYPEQPGVTPTAPNGSCELFCCDAEGNKFARILFVLNDAK